MKEEFSIICERMPKVLTQKWWEMDIYKNIYTYIHIYKDLLVTACGSWRKSGIEADFYLFMLALKQLAVLVTAMGKPRRID